MPAMGDDVSTDRGHGPLLLNGSGALPAWMQERLPRWTAIIGVLKPDRVFPVRSFCPLRV